MKFSRRQLLRHLTAWTGLARLRYIRGGPLQAAGTVRDGRLVTVRGQITLGEAGIILPHEHIMSLFGAGRSDRAVYDKEQLFAAVLPYLERVKNLGCGTIADCTAAFFGRAPRLLQEISEQSGIHIITNTGLYAAADDRYVPPFAFREDADQLARRWIREWRLGIEETGIRPGFIKIGVDAGSLSEIDGKIVRAAAIASRETGLTIASHTGGNPETVREQLDILAQEKADPSRWIWVHAQNVENLEDLRPAAEAGIWIEFDGVSQSGIDHHFQFVEWMMEQGHAGQMLLSHDGNSFRYGGREPKPYDALFLSFLPLLRSRGWGEEQIRQLTVENPFRALALG